MRARYAFLLLIIIAGFTGCKKKETEDPFYLAEACFHLGKDKIQVDSSVIIVNCSDSANVTYHWDFGDGTSSTVRSPEHSYKNYGNYTITLKTFVNSTITDSTSRNIQIIIGEKYYDFLQYSAGIDFAEGTDSSIMLLGTTRNAQVNKLFISKFDKNLSIKWIKYLNPDLNPYLENIERLSDGNFIIAGSFDNSANSGHFTISKIDSSGNVIWNKAYPQTNGYCMYANAAKDGGFIAVGNETFYHSTGNTIEIVSILKTDANGNFEWKKQFVDEWLMGTNNIASVNDGFVFASSTCGNTGIINSHDSLVINKIDFNKNTVWKKSIHWQIPNTSIIYSVGASTISVSENNIAVINDGNPFVVLFDLNGNYLHRGLSDIEYNRLITRTNNDKIIIGGGPWTWVTLKLNEFNSLANQDWSKYYGKRNTICTPSTGFSSSAKSTFDGSILVLGTSFIECTQNQESSLLLFRINESGEIL